MAGGHPQQVSKRAIDRSRKNLAPMAAVIAILMPKYLLLQQMANLKLLDLCDSSTV